MTSHTKYVQDSFWLFPPNKLCNHPSCLIDIAFGNQSEYNSDLDPLLSNRKRRANDVYLQAGET